LKGTWIDVANLADCDPIITVTDLENRTVLNGTQLPPGAPANPCGLVAKSYFNDTFLLYNGSGTTDA